MKLCKRAPVVGAVVALLVGLAACGGSDGESGGGPSGSTGGEQGVRIALLTVTANTYAQAANAAAEKAAKAEGATIQTFDAAFDPQKQLGQLQDAVASGKFDAIALLPLAGATLRSAISDAEAKGVPIVAFDLPVGPDTSTAEPGVPGVVASILKPADEDGKDIAALVVAACRRFDPCRVGYLLGDPALVYDQAKINVVKETIKQHPNIEIVATTAGRYLADPARSATQDMLQAHPEINVIASNGDQMTVGAEQAVKGLGREGDIVLLGEGGSKLGVDAVRAKRWFGTTLLLPEVEGRLAVEYAVRAARGEEFQVGVDEMSERGSVPRVLTVENLDEWSDFEAQWAG